MRQIGVLIASVLVVFITSCTNGKLENAELPFDTMKVVVWDLMNVNEWNNVRVVNDTVARKLRDDRVQYQLVFSWHHITKDQFYKSFTYYEQHPDKMKLLIDSVRAYGDTLKTKELKKAE